MKHLSILYIEDDDRQRREYSKQLGKKGLHVFTAASGKAGLQLLESEQIEAILCDLNMPEMDGLEVLKQIQKNHPHLPVIILTAHGTVTHAVEAMKQGASHFALKPLDADEIEIRIRQAIETNNLKKRLKQSEDTLKMLTDNVPDVIYSLNPKGQFISLSPSVKNVLGYQPSELLGKSVIDIIHPEDQSRVLSGFRQSVEAGEDNVKTLQFRMYTKSGEEKHFEISRKLYFENGEVVRSDGIARDITERKQLEYELKKYSLELEKRVAERTESLEYANRQLMALNEVSNKFAQIYDEETLFNEAPKLLTESLDFDRAAIILRENGKYSLRSYCFGKDSPQIIKDYLDLINQNDVEPPFHLNECVDKQETIFIENVDEISDWPQEIKSHLDLKSLVAAPLVLRGKTIGIVEGDMRYHEREMHQQDVARFQMFASMVGLALDNILAYQDLENKVAERTKSLSETNARLEEKAGELEKASYKIANANVELLSTKEELEQKNQDMENLLSEISRNREVLQSILDLSMSVIIMVDHSGNIIASNKQVKKYFGTDYQQVLKMSFSDFLGDLKDQFENRASFEQLTQKLQREPDVNIKDLMNVEKVYERAYRLKGDKSRYISIFSTPVADQNKKEIGKVWTFMDITKMKEADEKLRAIVDVSPVPYIISRMKDGTILYINQPLASLIKMKAEDLLGRQTPNFYANPEDRKYVLNKIQEEGFIHNHEVQIRRADGSIIWMIMSLAQSEINGEPVLIGALYDINERRQAEEALRKERNFVSAILDTAGALVLVLNSKGEIVRFNRACENLTGKSGDEVSGKKVWDLFLIPEEIEPVKEAFSNLKAGNLPHNFENYWIAKNGNLRLINWSNTVLYDENNEIDYIIATGIDITERKEAEDRLRLYREIFLNSNDGIAIFDPQGNFMERNPAHKLYTGYSEGELEGTNIVDLMGKDAAQPIAEKLKERGSYRGEVISSAKDGTIYNVDLSIFSIYNDQQELECYVGIARDITKRKKAEDELREAHDKLEQRVHERTKELADVNEALRDSEAKNRALLNAIPDLIFRLNKEGVYLDYQAPKGSELAVSPDTIVGKTIYQTLPPDIAEKAMGKISIALQTNETQIMEYQLDHEGKLHYFEARIVVSDMGEVLTIVRDITEQKQAQKALQKAHDELEMRVKQRTAELAQTNDSLKQEISERIQAEKTLEKRLMLEEGLAASSQSLLTYNDPNQAINGALQGLLRATESERIYIFENFTDEKDELCMRPVYETCAKGVNPEAENPEMQRIPYKDGFKRWESKLSKGEPIYGYVSQFPKKERELLKSVGARSILVLPITVEGKWYGFIGLDDLNKPRKWGDEDIRILKTATEMIGGYISKKQAENALMVSEERFRSLVENAHDIIYSMKPDGTFSYISPQFTEYTGYEVEEFLGKTMEPLIYSEDLAASDKRWQQTDGKLKTMSGHEYRIKHKDGSLRWFISHSTDISDDNGNIIETIGIAHDVTDMKTMMENLERTNRELRQTQAQLVQSEKMAALGMLVAGIAHEINTPVGAVNSMHNTLMRAVGKLKSEFSEKYPEFYKNNKRLNSVLEIIEEANKVISSGTARVKNIVSRLRSFARLDEAELKEADIHEGLEDTLTLIHHEIKHHVTVNRNYGEISKIHCYPGKLNQVFLNLLINASQAIKDKGEITISTFERDNFLNIEIEDTGSGIPPDKLAHIFDPGYTTKGVGVGTGLGLSIVYQIIQDHHGQIDVESTMGKGTKFMIKIPVNLDEILQWENNKN